MQKVVPHLWFPEKAEEAINLYVSLIPDSKVTTVATMPAESPSGPSGSVKIIDFTLGGSEFQAIEAGPLDAFNHAVSFIINCDTQEEVDRLWEALGDGGQYEPCGWLKDRYGLSWQITPTVLGELMNDPDEERGKRVAEAMLQMGKLDIQGLKDAYDGKAA